MAYYTDLGYFCDDPFLVKIFALSSLSTIKFALTQSVPLKTGVML